MARTILLADDSVTAQNMGRRILSDAGYEVITVNNGSAALKKVAESAPDLIVLDVYMPGYGGLEVCQRLKESQATSRIPVLLTVGKLEPFKVEEARRVRADAHIVKPFDSTELLAAIIKLEDKIVPQAATSKPRSTKAASSMEGTSTRRSREKSAEPGTETSSGWKKRLSFPRGAPAPEITPENVPDKPKVANTEFHELVRTPEPAEAKLQETPTVESVSHEIPAVSESVASTRPFESFTLERLMEIEAAVAAPEAAPSTQENKAQESSTPEDAVAELPLPEAVTIETPPIELAPASKTEPVTNERSPSEDEVMAALASLSPVNDPFQSAEVNATENAPSDLRTVFQELPVGAAASGLAVSAISSGPRWIAEAVPLSDGDSHLILESEMEKVYASFSAAEHTTEEMSPSLVDSFQSSAATDGRSLTPENATATEPATPKVEADASPAIEESRTPEAVLVDAVTESTTTEPAMEVVSNEEVKAPVIEEGAAPPSEEITSIGYREIAYAAAASAGSKVPSRADSGDSHFSSAEFPVDAAGLTAANSDAVQAIPAPDPAQSGPLPAAESNVTPEASDGVNQEHAAHLDAAWHDWRQLRDDVVGPQLTTQIADAAAAGFRQLRGEESAPTTRPEADTTTAADQAVAAAAAQASTIASIVDSVFAELKPKLMEEIAKKLAADRK